MKFVQKIKTHFVFNNLFSAYRAVYEIMWKTLYNQTAFALHAGQLRLQTHSEYVIFIAFRRQQW